MTTIGLLEDIASLVATKTQAAELPRCEPNWRGMTFCEVDDSIKIALPGEYSFASQSCGTMASEGLRASFPPRPPSGIEELPLDIVTESVVREAISTIWHLNWRRVEGTRLVGYY